MTIIKEQLEAEIKGRIALQKDLLKRSGDSARIEGSIDALQGLLNTLDTLEEPVCEELNEAAENYSNAQPEIENVTYHDSLDISPQLEQAFIAGANWGAEHLKK